MAFTRTQDCLAAYPRLHVLHLGWCRFDEVPHRFFGPYPRGQARDGELNGGFGIHSPIFHELQLVKAHTKKMTTCYVVCNSDTFSRGT